MFPRILAGNTGLLDCSHFNTNYPCPNSTNESRRSSMCDKHSCESCLFGDTYGAGHGFKCLKHEKICRLPQEFIHDNVSDCDRGEDLCFAADG